MRMYDRNLNDELLAEQQEMHGSTIIEPIQTSTNASHSSSNQSESLAA
jgi:hypothetical protein